MTALYIAVEKQNAELVKVLVERKDVNVNARQV